MNRRRQLLAALGAGALATPLDLLAQQGAGYPNKPVRLIVASTAGGGDDFVARLIASKLSDALGQQFVVENRPGAGGNIGQTAVAKSAPDGYTLLLAGISMAGARFVNANVGYDLFNDFSPISWIEISPFALAINPALPARDLKEFIALARARPGKLGFATIGAGQIPYWGVMLFNSMAGINALEVPYKGPSEAIVDLIAGRVDYTVTPAPVALTNKDKLRVLAVTSTVRSEAMPEVPTMAEAGLPGYDMAAMRGIMGPAGMRRDVVETLNRAMVQILATADMKERLSKAGSIAISSTPEEMTRRYQDRMAIFGKIAKDAGLKPQ
jgi:tripartite-type tricarboxylate transporter receptor subunit TctC